MLTKRAIIIKRLFDIIGAFIGLVLLIMPICFLIVLSTIFHKSNGLYCQKRVGQHAKLFTIFKIKTMHNLSLAKESKLSDLDKFGITLKDDKRVTVFGSFLRKYRLDELPQLINVLIGNMSFVGPRPDIEGYADELRGTDRILLTVKPGITGPATLAFRNEDSLLFDSVDPIVYNKEVIWPEKVKLNIDYVKNWSFKKDIYYIFQTIFN